MISPGRRFPLYRQLIRLYPEPYRSKYGPQMLQTLADMLDDAPDKKTRLSIHSRSLLDIPLSLAEQYITIGGAMVQDMPSYIKRTTIIGVLLLVPFLLALSANTLDSLLYDRALYTSWLWHTPVLAIWVLWLPLAAVLLTLGSLIRYEIHALRSEHKNLATLFAIRRTWPVLAVALVGIGILALVFGHDSGHCLMQNPVTTFTHLSQTWQCVQQGSADYPFHHPLEFLKQAFGL